MPKRADYGRDAIAAILDAAPFAQLATVRDGTPRAVPTLHARVGDRVYVHGSSASPSLRALAAGTPACLTATILDGLVLARSAVNHSVNYRSVVVHGEARAVTAPDEKEAALRAFTEKLVPGRWAEVRSPTPRELKATAVLWMALDEASAKVREGPPLDDEPDHELDCWAGVVPMTAGVGTPVPDPRLRAGIPEPPSVSRLRRPPS